MKNGFKRKPDSKAFMYSNKGPLRITRCQSIEIFAEKQQVKWLAHSVRMKNYALQKLSLFMTTTKKNYMIGYGPAAVLEITQASIAILTLDMAASRINHPHEVRVYIDRKDGTDPMSRNCGQFQETVDHLVSGCPERAKTEYIQRHNKAAAYLHWTICKPYNVKVQDKHYEHELVNVTENQTVTILWDMPIQTDKEIKANRPDIAVKDKKERTCLLMDMFIPTERNTSLKTIEKLTKYKDLEIEIEKT